MSHYIVSKVFNADKATIAKVDALLSEEGIRRDANLDYTCAIYDDQGQVIATGSTFGNTLRCLAVSSKYQGEGLMNMIVSHLIDYQADQGHFHLFLYTKTCTAPFFADLGFKEIVRIENLVSFMENKASGFQHYLNHLERPAQNPPRVAAIVVNANPFTLGHQYLIEKASQENDLLHLFMVSEDASLVPFSVRKELVLKGTSHLKNIIYHDSGDYIISQSTFPAYFQKDQTSVIESQAEIDLEIFTKIAQQLGISRRYVGDEPTSLVTNLYNQIMKEKLPEHGIDCFIIPRKTFAADRPISASTARQAIKEGDWNLLEHLLPKTSLDYFKSEAAQAIIARIRQEKNVIHY
ncbi:[citrate (pro-3S)-lyase] ligase [Streptococcus plurextorum]|uniref:[citrate (pro-3S)-lyase] ligase n=1 Tax=Streptococcus plurextorum TaxID=456876 RepID=UPI00040BE9D9|nr:[citrate (pro-3S)-lyase] ligase [Streptococcus plurextorum]